MNAANKSLADAVEFFVVAVDDSGGRFKLSSNNDSLMLKCCCCFLSSSIMLCIAQDLAPITFSSDDILLAGAFTDMFAVNGRHFFGTIRCDICESFSHCSNLIEPSDWPINNVAAIDAIVVACKNLSAVEGRYLIIYS